MEYANCVCFLIFFFLKFLFWVFSRQCLEDLWARSSKVWATKPTVQCSAIQALGQPEPFWWFLRASRVYPMMLREEHDAED